MRNAYRHEQATEDLKNLLRKLGIKSANIFPGLSEQDLRDMMSRVQNNYGAPDQILMDPTSFEALRKAFKK